MATTTSNVIRRGLRSITQKRPDDVVLVTALRTPVGRFKGSFKDTYPEELLAHVLKATRQRLEKQGFDVQGGKVEDIAVGTVLMELSGAKSGRLASLHAGFPYSTTFRTVNRQCSSSLQSVSDIAASIQQRTIDIGIAAGTESMTKNYGTRAVPADLSPRLKESWSQDAKDCIMPMGLTSENVASQYGIGRERQDNFALSSHQKAEHAQKQGWFDQEIVPITVNYVEKPKEEGGVGEEVMKTVTKDEGVRSGLTIQKLASLKPAFKEDGCSTAGNSSQISDGASAVTLARRDVAERLGLKPIARFVGTAVVGVPPRVMGTGPAFSTPVLLKRFGLEVKDVDLFELNEAFASQALMTIDHLGLDEARVNPKGGAIALGHPLGATGGRLVSSLITQLHRTNKEIGVATLCCGTGFGLSHLYVAE